MIQALKDKIAVKKIKSLAEKEEDMLKGLMGTECYNYGIGDCSPSGSEKYQGEVISCGDEVKDLKKGEIVYFREYGEPDTLTNEGDKVYIISEWSVLGKES